MSNPFFKDILLDNIPWHDLLNARVNGFASDACINDVLLQNVF